MNNLTALILLPENFYRRDAFIAKFQEEIPEAVFYTDFATWQGEYANSNAIGVIDTAALTKADRLILATSLDNGSVGRNIVVLTHEIADLAIPGKHDLHARMANTITPHELAQQVRLMHEKLRQTA